MNNLYSNLILVGCILALLLIGCVVDACAYAYYDRAYSICSSEDLWNTLLDEKRTEKIIQYLRKESWVKADVSDEDLDYILVLTKQIADMYDNVRPELAMAMIAVESRFDSSAGSGSGARGLMQILPYYHKDRIMQFIEADATYSEDLFNSPRLNIVTGIDYISEILEQTDGDEAFALMWYNEGPSSADKRHKKGSASSYAKAVLSTAEDIAEILNAKPVFH